MAGRILETTDVMSQKGRGEGQGAVRDQMSDARDQIFVLTSDL
jgi:hypothetical protein